MQEQTTNIDLNLLFEAYAECEKQHQLYSSEEITHNEIIREKLAEELFKLGAAQRRELPIYMLKELHPANTSD